MKKIIYFFIVFLLTAITFGQSQDTVKAYPGIPIITYQGMKIDFATDEQFDNMKAAGIFSVVTPNLTEADFLNKIEGSGLLIMPEQVDNSVVHHIYRYTEAIYTEWEAEGTPEEDGLVTLYSGPIACEKYNGTVRTTNMSQKGTLIYGPMYRQEKYYAAVDPGDSIVYTARYFLKLEDVDPWLESAPDDTVCILQVTSSRTWDDIAGWGFHDIYIIKDSVITYGDFHSINQLQDFDLEYHLMDVPIDFQRGGPEESILQHPFIVTKNSQSVDRQSVNCIEFKVIWKGNPNVVRLSVDKIIVFDERGWDIMTNEFTQGLIVGQMDTNEAEFGESRIAGWIGIDEPWNLDFWGPIRKVSEIIDANSSKAKLWFQFNTSWNGRFGDYGDVARASKVIMIDEFMRRVKKANVWITHWLYDLPCDGIVSDFPCNGQEDFKILNINWAADSIYNKLLDASHIYPDLHYGLSLQTGRYQYLYNNHLETRIREINGRELLYNTNLALIYGSKLISPWLYFGGWADPAIYTGLRNWPDFNLTDKYLTLRDTIAPRLSNLLGKTLRNLVPDTQFVGSNGISYSNILWDYNPSGYKYIEEIYPTNYIPALDEYGIDMGFFENPESQDDKYFMVLNRYYSTLEKFTIVLNSLDQYMNWNLTNYVDSTSQMFVAENQSITFLDTLYKGDANLYSIIPVVKAGGIIAVDDTISTNITLSNKMTINNNAVLFIKAGKFYTVQDTITLEGSGSKILGDGYLEIASGGEVIIYNWSHSLFKGKHNDHPKLYWGKFTGNAHTGYKIYRKKETTNFIEIATLAPSARSFIDTTVFIIEGPHQSNEVAAEYYVVAVYENGRSTSNSNTIVYQRVEGSGLDKISMGSTNQPIEYDLFQNYPNPFNPTTTIKYSVKEPGVVELVVLNILGQKVNELVNEFQSEGNYEVNFNASSLASGIYLYRIKVNDFVSAKKMILVK